MSVRRYTDPVYLQFVWNAIEACSRDSIESTFHELLSFIQRECDSKCTAAKLQSELSNAISDGCIECNQRCYLKRDPMPKGKDKHDWYAIDPVGTLLS
ncbi:Zinc finger MYND domain-containing protein 11 [Schistosoma japonicum]|nr:Zinc finger MYND domain-containing protein 11 [Schistosoma japonicum]